MRDLAIRAESVGKRFEIGSDEPFRTLRDSLVRAVCSPFRAAAPRRAGDSIWALRDVSFEIRRGEVIGIIGANGAGKSTLLKILSRITAPTRGRVEIRGRVGSLLEVGTGFHPELSGRENVFLNGTILGMRRAEISARFDEIVAFADVERFLDTPVKRYSSGMRVRLAFAVAAHLEPEILIVDEVLAVGDAAFQRKCLGKMSDVAGQGRTVLFVSHNMAAVSTLCSRAMLLAGGRVGADGPTERIVAAYLDDSASRTALPVADRTDRSGSGRIRFTEVRVRGGGPDGRVVTGCPVEVTLAYRAKSPEPIPRARFALTVMDPQSARVFVLDSQIAGADWENLPPAGEVICRVPHLPLAAGAYDLRAWVEVAGEAADLIDGAARIQVGEGDFFGTGRVTVIQKHGPYVVDHGWRFAAREPGIAP